MLDTDSVIGIIEIEIGIAIGIEERADQRPIPIPIATPTPKDIVILTFYGFIKYDGLVKSPLPMYVRD